MKHISFNPRFVNKAGNDLIPGKIHTIRQNYEWWKSYEGKEVALFTWEGKPYQKGSKQKVFCVKRIVSVQEVYFCREKNDIAFFFTDDDSCPLNIPMAFNDGFHDEYRCTDDLAFLNWFRKKEYKPGKMAVLHFTDFRY